MGEQVEWHGIPIEIDERIPPNQIHVRSPLTLDEILDRLRDAEDIIRRFAVGERPDGTYNFSREAAEQQCKAYLEKYPHHA